MLAIQWVPPLCLTQPRIQLYVHCMSPLQGLTADVTLNLELPDYLPAVCAAMKSCSAAPGRFPLFKTSTVTEAMNVLPTVQRCLAVPR
jgi:hypothetical protein